MTQKLFRFIAVLRSQYEKGAKKYGVTIENADLSVDELIKHLEQELVDAWVYLQEIKRRLKK